VSYQADEIEQFILEYLAKAHELETTFMWIETNTPCSVSSEETRAAVRRLQRRGTIRNWHRGSKRWKLA
jgi:hypothetical protein